MNISRKTTHILVMRKDVFERRYGAISLNNFRVMKYESNGNSHNGVGLDVLAIADIVIVIDHAKMDENGDITQNKKYSYVKNRYENPNNVPDEITCELFLSIAMDV